MSLIQEQKININEKLQTMEEIDQEINHCDVVIEAHRNEMIRLNEENYSLSWRDRLTLAEKTLYTIFTFGLFYLFFDYNKLNESNQRNDNSRKSQKLNEEVSKLEVKKRTLMSDKNRLNFDQQKIDAKNPVKTNDNSQTNLAKPIMINLQEYENNHQSNQLSNSNPHPTLSSLNQQENNDVESFSNGA